MALYIAFSTVRWPLSDTLWLGGDAGVMGAAWGVQGVLLNCCSLLLPGFSRADVDRTAGDGLRVDVVQEGCLLAGDRQQQSAIGSSNTEIRWYVGAYL